MTSRTRTLVLLTTVAAAFDCQRPADTGAPAAIGVRTAALGGEGPPLQALLNTPVTLDGILSPGEWDDASVEHFGLCGGDDPGRILLKNDGTTLYVALEIQARRHRPDPITVSSPV